MSSRPQLPADTLSVALDYIKLHPDRYSFPLLRDKSRPALKNNLELASNDPTQLKAWHDRWPGCLWGCATKKSEIVCVDIDCGAGKEGSKSVVALKEAGFTFPNTEKDRTPSGGWHLIYKGAHHFSASKIGLHIDTPNYFVIPGCVRRDGKGYRVADGSIDAVPLPDWIAEKIKPRADRPRRESVGEPVPLELFKQMLSATPYMGGPEGLDDRHSYEGWLTFMFACHEAAGGDDGPYLWAFTDWCDGDPSGKESWTAESIERHWQSATADPPTNMAAVTRASWFKLLSHLGHGELVATAQAIADFAADPLEPLTPEKEKEQEAILEMNAATPSQRAPRVVITAGALPKATRQVKNHLIDDSDKPRCPASDKIFRRGSALGSALVHLNRNELSPENKERGHDDDYHVADDLMIRVADRHWLGDRAERSIRFVKPNRDGKLVPADAPYKLLERLGTIITRRDFPPLHATTETPTLRKDRSLLDKPGYDRKSGLFYDPGRAVFPPIPDRPTKEDARKALALFIGERGILPDFPFTDEPDEPQGLSRAVALAMLLTSVSRRALPTAPGFGVDAYEAQSGKTLLAELAAIMATGRKAAERPWPTDEYQRSTALAAALEGGDAVLLYDNVDVPLESAIFCGAITEERIAVRRLGGNSAEDQIVAPTNALIIWTGNHLIAQGDMAEGRVLITRIVPDRELTKRKFQHRDLAAHVMKHRPELVAAALTILRGYAVAKDKVAPTGFRHHAWGDLVGASIEWLGLPNPVLAEKRAQAADPVREVHNDVVRAWARTFGEKWVTVNQLISEYQIANIIAGAKGIDAGKLTFKTAGPFLREMIGLPRLGFKVEMIAGDKYHPARWRLKAGLGAVVMGQEDQESAEHAAADFADDLA